jgi:hypothetical protein
MKIDIRGRPIRIPKKIVRKAVEHFSDLLMNQRLHSKIDTDLTFVSKDTDELDPSEFGITYATYGEDNKHRHFEVFLFNDLSIKATLLTLAHEWVHIKQYASGQLYDFMRADLKGLSRWNGELYNREDEMTEYWFRPWEIEAMGYEQGLVRTFLAKMKEEGTSLNARIDLG